MIIRFDQYWPDCPIPFSCNFRKSCPGRFFDICEILARLSIDSEHWFPKVHAVVVVCFQKISLSMKEAPQQRFVFSKPDVAKIWF
jgi:hypothetical protein